MFPMPPMFRPNRQEILSISQKPKYNKCTATEVGKCRPSLTFISVKMSSSCLGCGKWYPKWHCMTNGSMLQRHCQGLAGPWCARHEREAVKAKVQWFNGSKVQMRAWAQAGQKTRGNNELQEIDEDKTKDQLQLLSDTYCWGRGAYNIRA